MARHPVGLLERSLLVVLAALALLSALLLARQLTAPVPLTLGGLTVDRLGAAMALLVATIGAVTYHFALRYLDGEPGQRQFLRWLGFTVASAYLLMLATNLALLFAFWTATSIGLHQLLTFYGDRAATHPPARKKLLISRLGDLALLAAIGLVWQEWGTLDLPLAMAAASAAGPLSPASTAVALLISTAALTKSAQFPFHSWLPETMEAPTPVSALMHAGIINAGGVLLLRFAPLLIAAPSALLLLTVIGALTTLIATLTMWTQTTVKRTLAWSTVAQMGFMMIQCGLGAFSVAALHIVGHGCYKAWSFLRSGELPSIAAPSPIAPLRRLIHVLIGLALAIPALALAAWLTGFSPWHSPGELALTAIVAMALGQLWASSFGTAAARTGAAQRGALATALLLGGAGLALGLYRAANLYFAPLFGQLPADTGQTAWLAALIVIAVYLALTILQPLLPLLGGSRLGRALFVHALHGWYIGVFADRLVARLWRMAGRAGVTNG